MEWKNYETICTAPTTSYKEFHKIYANILSRSHITKIFFTLRGYPLGAEKVSRITNDRKITLHAYRKQNKVN